MFNNKNRVIIFLLTVWMINSSASLSGQEFSDFFINFIRYPEKQVFHTQFPLKSDNITIKNSKSFSPITFLTRNNLPIICQDSLNAIGNYFSNPVVSIIQLSKETAINYSFEKQNKEWKLVSYKNENSQNIQESEFINFLIQYSKDGNFQMKHTIFPFPYRIYKASKTDPENKLLMPREWESVDFSLLFPSLCIFNSENNQTSNRRLFIFRNGKKSQLFNFIRINKKWYLIEIEEYK